ncbi:MAG TPA: HAD family phosphatase [Candidatus Sulfotelmatobacter sp.]|nr:HAD family phosphatase [Candidatus Sulfotelmatobacter sp.]
MANNGKTGRKRVEAVIFDYGEVLSHRPTADENARLASFFRLPADQLPALWERNRGAYDRGDLAPAVYWAMLAKDAGVDLSPDQLDAIHKLDLAMWSSINSSMVDWLGQLRLSGMKLGLLSNMHPEMVAHCRKQFSWLKNFDFVTFSGEVRLIKPEPAIYEHTLRGLGVSASEALFLDDREINIRAAQALGINALRFESIEQLRRELESAGFPVLPQV